MTIRTLIVDIETKPTKGFFWALFDQNIGLNQIDTPGGIICWAAHWDGSDEVEFSSIHMTSYKNMIGEIWKLLDEADEVVGWNSDSFDLKLLNAAFAVLGLGPPSPYKKIDLMKETKKNMKFLSNKLDYVAGMFGVGHKVQHAGFSLWLDCMKGDDKAWSIMREYNEEDVLITARMLAVLRPWLSTNINRSAYYNAVVCPNCGGSHLQSRGFYHILFNKYRRFRCMDCGKWTRANKAEPKERIVQQRGIR